MLNWWEDLQPVKTAAIKEIDKLELMPKIAGSMKNIVYHRHQKISIDLMMV